MRATTMVETHVKSWVAQRPAPVHATARTRVRSAGFCGGAGIGAPMSATISVDLLSSGSKLELTLVKDFKNGTSPIPFLPQSPG